MIDKIKSDPFIRFSSLSTSPNLADLKMLRRLSGTRSPLRSESRKPRSCASDERDSADQSSRTSTASCCLPCYSPQLPASNSFLVPDLRLICP